MGSGSGALGDSSCSHWTVGILLDGGLPSLLAASGRNERMQEYGFRWASRGTMASGGRRNLWRGPTAKALPAESWFGACHVSESDLGLTSHPLSALLRISSPFQEAYLEDCCVGQNSHCRILDHYIGYSVGHRSDSCRGHRTDCCGHVPESLMSLKEAPGAWMGPGGFPIPQAVRFMVYEGSGFENASLGSHTHMHTRDTLSCMIFFF